MQLQQNPEELEGKRKPFRKANLLQDDNLNWSSTRFVFLYACVLIVWMILLWSKAYSLEIVKDEPNYDGLALLFREMVTLFAAAVLLKVLDKVADLIKTKFNKNKDGNP